jgi:hypothetical protein
MARLEGRDRSSSRVNQAVMYVRKAGRDRIDQPRSRPFLVLACPRSYRFSACLPAFAAINVGKLCGGSPVVVLRRSFGYLSRFPMISLVTGV